MAQLHDAIAVTTGHIAGQQPPSPPAPPARCLRYLLPVLLPCSDAPPASVLRLPLSAPRICAPPANLRRCLDACNSTARRSWLSHATSTILTQNTELAIISVQSNHACCVPVDHRFTENRDHIPLTRLARQAGARRFSARPGSSSRWSCASSTSRSVPSALRFCPS